MRISVITPSFNQSAYLEKTILSVIKQNYITLEYIIIDGNSMDGSIELIKKYEKHLSYWVSEKDKGQSEAINKGFKKASGDIVAWLNSDDIYLPGTLETVSKLFADNPDLDLIYGDVINLYENDKEEYYHVKQFDPSDFLSRNPIHQPSVFWRRKLLDETGLLDESLHYFMDYDLWLNIFLNYKTLKIDKPLSKFRVHAQSKTSSNPPAMYLEYRKVLSKFFNSFEEDWMVDKLKNLGIYINEENKKYSLSKKKYALKKMLDVYIHQCAIQEYSWKNIKRANTLFFNSLGEPSILNNLVFLLKNNLGIKHFTS